MSHPTTTADEAPTPAETDLAFVKLMRDTGVAVIDVDAGTHVATVGDGRHPHGLAFHPGGRWVSIAFAGSSTIQTVDRRSLSVLDRTETVGTAPIGIEYARDGRYLFVTGYGELPGADEPGLTVLRAEDERRPGERNSSDPSLELLATRRIGKCAGAVVDRSNDLWIALKDDDAVVRLDAEPPFEMRDRLEVPGDPQDLAYAPELGLLGVNNVDDGSVSFVDVDRRTLVGTVDAPNPRGGVASVEHGRWLVGDTEGDGVTVIDLGDDAGSDAGPELVEQRSLATPTAFPDVTPDGEYAVVDAYEDDRVTFLEVASLEVVARVETGPEPRHPRFGADGRRCYVPNVSGDSFSVLDTEPLFRTTDGPPTVERTVDLPEDSAPSSCFLTEHATGDTP
ncbi:beta-propeller fold lactonase family protein [Halobiforma nitratireducens]|uniref:40-residue YVTN family beta-propeller repeat-containing protein n=1 Tax=Halobiforma nitratireducens JCM 10879 TaxID=1227454 RepID=M0L1B7_9EURY|nr:hypothetical protein [Halobiforma nitratireducens]EMA27341.1 hypothetical protein C446_18071 [Halobiforma nitratireducens JCM 10879]